MRRLVTTFCIAMSIALFITFSADAQRHSSGRSRTTAKKAASAPAPQVKPEDPSVFAGKARELFEQALAGDALAQYEIACVYADYDCVFTHKEDVNQAFYWASKSAAQDCAAGLWMQAYCYEQGVGVKKNESKAKELYAKAYSKARESASHDARSMYVLGKLYRYGDGGVEKELSKTYEWYVNAACAGFGKAMNAVGLIYWNGNGVPKDFVKAQEWFLKAGNAGYSWGYNNLGNDYRDGNGVPQDYVKAMEYFRKAAYMGNGTSMNAVGLLYWNGNGVPKDFAKAQEWFLKAGNAGCSWGYNNLGNDYRDGNGVPQDYAKAMEYFRKAADMGNGTSMNAVGLLYWNGNGVAKNYKTANDWFLKAGNAGEAWGYNNLGNSYRDGEGVAQNMSKAQEYYRKAADMGNEAAEKSLGNLIVREGNKFVGNWSDCLNLRDCVSLDINWYSSDKTGEDAEWLYAEVSGGVRTPFNDPVILVGKVENSVLKLQNTSGMRVSCTMVEGRLNVTGLVGKQKWVFVKD